MEWYMQWLSSNSIYCIYCTGFIIIFALGAIVARITTIFRKPTTSDVFEGLLALLAAAFAWPILLGVGIITGIAWLFTGPWTKEEKQPKAKPRPDTHLCNYCGQIYPSYTKRCTVCGGSQE